MSISCAWTLGQPRAQLGEVARRAHARDDVLALRVRQEVARRLGRAGQLVARERDAAAAALAEVAEHHLLHVDRRAPLVGDAVDAPVGDRALALPGVEHGADRRDELLARDRRGTRRSPGTRRSARAARRRRARCRARRRAPPCAPRSPARSARPGRRARRCRTSARSAGRSPTRSARRPSARARPSTVVVVEPEVQHRVEHPRHRLARARAHRHEQRVARRRRAACPRAPRGARSASATCSSRPVGNDPPPPHVGDAGLRRDREARRHALGARARASSRRRSRPCRRAGRACSREPSAKSMTQRLDGSSRSSTTPVELALNPERAGTE